MKLSDRTDWPMTRSAWSNTVQAAQRAGRIAADLTVSNPTAVGLVHDDEVYAALGDAAAQVYAPEPFGLLSARQAVAGYYALSGLAVDPARVWLTASTSEAYGQLLTLLCDPSEAVMIPAPGYPLLDVLGSLASVARRPYPLLPSEGWAIDMLALQSAAQVPGARAIVVVAPGNPTGAYLDRLQWNGLVRICTELGLSLIVDEVFCDYPLEAPPGRLMRVPDDPPMPTFVLSGLSKVSALPQMKLSWVVALGPAPDISAILRRAEHVADATLSVSGPVQLALPRLLAAAEPLRDKIMARLNYNLVGLRKAVEGQPLDVPRVEGGWTALVRLPQVIDDDAWAERLLDAGVLVQPGYLYDLPSRPPWIALSLLAERDVFARGVELLLQCVQDVLEE
jgi:aspartate/methionine/tyrosine aminotransferase